MGYETHVTRFVTTPTQAWLAERIQRCLNRLLFASPYVGNFLNAFAEIVPATISTTLVTRTDLRDFALGSSDIQALCDFARRGTRILSLAGLHAKVYVMDDSAALVTSANATYSGMTRNWECGVAIEERSEVRQLASLVLSGFGSQHSLEPWSVDEIEALKEPVRVLRQQLPPIKKLRTLEASDLPPIPIPRRSRASVLDAFSGWTRLVLDAVLSGKDSLFTLDQLAESCSPLAAKMFPRNRFVRPQLRKQLQRLRDLGFVDFLGGGRYLRTVES